MEDVIYIVYKHARLLIICRYNYISRFLSKKSIIILFIKYRFKRPSHKDETSKRDDVTPSCHKVRV